MSKNTQNNKQSKAKCGKVSTEKKIEKQKIDSAETISSSRGGGRKSRRRSSCSAKSQIRSQRISKTSTAVKPDCSKCVKIGSHAGIDKKKSEIKTRVRNKKSKSGKGFAYDSTSASETVNSQNLNKVSSKGKCFGQRQYTKKKSASVSSVGTQVSKRFHQGNVQHWQSKHFPFEYGLGTSNVVGHVQRAPCFGYCSVNRNNLSSSLAPSLAAYNSYSSSSTSTNFSSMSGKKSSSSYHARKSKKSPNTAATQSGDNIAEIPGFYYDKEKKRYFKILQHDKGVNTMTRESIMRKEAEQRRQIDLIQVAMFKPLVQDADPPKHNLVKLFRERITGAINQKKYENMCIATSCCRLRPTQSSTVVNYRTVMGFSSVEHMLHMQLFGPNNDEVLGVWSVKDNAVQKMQLLKLTGKPKSDDNSGFGMEVDQLGVTVLQTWNKITDVCLAPQGDDPSCRRVLYTTMSYIDNNYSLALIRDLNSFHTDENPEEQCRDFNLGLKATWSCAWNPYTSRFSVGSEKKSLMVDVTSRQMWEFNTHKSDVLCQVFSKQGGNILFSGTRQGEVLAHDMRSSSTEPVKCFQHCLSVSSIRLLQDGYKMIVSDFAGLVKLWDLRMKHSALLYEGLLNEYTKIPIHVDPTESILYGAGQDCYMNIWDLPTGTLLNRIPPPCPASRDTIPTLQFATNLLGINGNIGMIVGAQDKIHMYTNP